MLEYFTYKKFKKNKTEKEEKSRIDKEKGKATSSSPLATPNASSSTDASKPVLTDDDERFFERLTTPSGLDDEHDEGKKPPLPPRVATPDLTWDSDTESFRKPRPKEDSARAESSQAGEKKANRFSMLFSKNKDKDKQIVLKGELQPNKLAVPDVEVDQETDDLTRVLDDLNLSARNNKAFALSSESSELVAKFTLVLKDLINGVPTAVNDLTSLLDDRDGSLQKNFEKLPKSLKKLVETLPTKLSAGLAPELLAVAAEAQGLTREDAAATGGVKGAAKRLLMPKNLYDLVTKPGAIVGMLKGIMNALKLRWPAFIGTNLIWSVAVFLLMFVLWYCHKRGREARLEREGQPGTVDGTDRIEELPDDPALPAPNSTVPNFLVQDTGTSSGPNLPPPPIGRNASGRKSPILVARAT